MSKCLYCEKEFEISPLQSGGHNRMFCYDCLPPNLNKQTRDKVRYFLILSKIEKEKIQRGCDRCGYNKNGAALEWHHPNQDKEFNPSDLIKSGNLNSYYNEIQKCELLCANCHRETHHQQSYEELLNNLDLTSTIKKPLIFKKDIITKYLELQSYKETADFFQCDISTVSTICKEAGIKTFNTSQKPVIQLNKNTNMVIASYPSLSVAAKAINKPGGGGHIVDVCKGKRHTAYGYKWQFVE